MGVFLKDVLVLSKKNNAFKHVSRIYLAFENKKKDIQNNCFEYPSILYKCFRSYFFLAARLFGAGALAASSIILCASSNVKFAGSLTVFGIL